MTHTLYTLHTPRTLYTHITQHTHIQSTHTVASYDPSSINNGMLSRRLSAPVFRNSLSSEDFDEQRQQETTPSGYHDDEKVDKVYTIGCFDLFHRGHKKLLKNMRKFGKEVTLLFLMTSRALFRI